MNERAELVGKWYTDKDGDLIFRVLRYFIKERFLGYPNDEMFLINITSDKREILDGEYLISCETFLSKLEAEIFIETDERLI